MNTRRLFMAAAASLVVGLVLVSQSGCRPGTVAGTGAASTGPNFVKNYSSALAEAQKSGKPMVVVFSAAWCGPCQQMKKSVYPSAEVQPLHDKFVWVYLDTDESDNEKVAKEFKVSGIPHIEFLDKGGKSIGQQVGSSDPAAFAKTLEGILKKASTAAPTTSTASN